MKRTITIFLAVVLALAIMMSLAACGENDEITQSLIGAWNSHTIDPGSILPRTHSLVFEYNGECTYDSQKGKFTIDKDNKEIVLQFSDGTSMTLTYELDDGKIVSLTNSKHIFTKIS